jgi:hypothetical protein
MITLKHLCQEYGIDPYPLRKKLRAHFKHQSNQRWKWQDDDPTLLEAKKIAKEMANAKAPRAK